MKRAVPIVVAVLSLAAGVVVFTLSSDNGASRSGGAPQTELRFQDAEGKPRALSDFRGKAVLLNVWATWCVPCREEMPALDRLQQKLGGATFEVIALSIDRGGIAAVRRFYDEIGIRRLAIYVDSESEVISKLRVLGIPTTLLIDAEGRELWRKTGPDKWDEPPMFDRLRGHSQPKPSPER